MSNPVHDGDSGRAAYVRALASIEAQMAELTRRQDTITLIHIDVQGDFIPPDEAVHRLMQEEYPYDLAKEEVDRWTNAMRWQLRRVVTSSGYKYGTYN